MTAAVAVPENDHARRYLDKIKLSPSKRNLTVAARRVHNSGRLAELGAHMCDGIVRTRVVDDGDTEMMAPGNIIAEVWVHAKVASDWAALARAVMGLHEVATSRGQLLVLAIYRATWADRARSWLSWRLG